MTFLAPTAGIIAAAIAVPALVFFYLLKLRRRPVRVSSTLLWSKATHDLQVNTPLRWLRPTALFFLQLLALAALIAALARPAIEGAGPEGSRVVIVIDRSASMSAADGRSTRTGEPDGSTRLAEAKRRAEELIDRLGRSGGARRPRAMVVALGADARAVTGFTDSPGALRDAVRSIGASDQPGDLEAALRLLGTLSAGGGEEASDGSGPAAERTAAYIFSDGAFRPPAAGGPFTAPGIAGVDVSLVRVGPEPPPPLPAAGAAPAPPPPYPGAANVGIVAINARRDLNDPALVRLFVRVQNAAANPAQTTLQLRIGAETLAVKSVQVPALTRDDSGRPRPGVAAATFELTRREGGAAVVSLGQRDLLAADDAAGVVLAEPLRPAVLVVAPEARADRFLMAVLEEMDLSRLLVIDGAGYAARMAGGGEGASAYDLVVFDRVTPAVVPPVATLSFGAGLPIPGLEVTPVAQPADGEPRAARFLAWRRGHPLLRHVPLDPIVVEPPMVVTLPAPGDEPRTAGAASPAGRPAPAGQVTDAASLAEGPDGTLIGLVEQGPIRRIIVGFELARSTLGPDVAFPVLMANALDFLTLRSEGDAGRSHRTNEPIAVRPARGAASIGVTGPLSFTIDLAGADGGGDEGGGVPLGVLERAGLYTLTGVVPADASLAVNLADADESLLGTSDSLDIVGAGSISGPGSDRSGTGPREIWPWFVLAGLLLASLEWLIYAWRMRP